MDPERPVRRLVQGRDGGSCGLGWGLRTWRRTTPGAGVRLDARMGRQRWER